MGGRSQLCSAAALAKDCINIVALKNPVLAGWCLGRLIVVGNAAVQFTSSVSLSRVREAEQRAPLAHSRTRYNPAVTVRQCSWHSRRNWRSNLASRFAFAEYRPCFQLTSAERAKPASVRGPVLAPPCIRQRPLRMAGPLQGVPFRVLAPHRGAVLGSPVGLPFLSHPRRCAWGSSLVLVLIPTSTPTSGVTYRANDGLATAMNMDMLDFHFLFSLTPISLKRFHLRRVGSHQPIGEVGVQLNGWVRLTFHRRATQVFHRQIVSLHHLRCQ